MRYIAINDGVDSAKGDNGFYPRSVICLTIFTQRTQAKRYGQSNGRQGRAWEHLTKPPYGYIVSPTDKKQWIADEEAAAVVKRIFDLCINGKGPMQIAKILKADNVLIAKAYYAEKGESTPR